ncbi:cryptococcal mannosyltransferase 1-domain-containing protein [Plectosphaerella cucumerina]|uniref:Cryptococcal mannosyltransferase 1-domain-containing protein n=1 Tax=Plectosphaerella cucumerina TaxID=40658 RepID=A0A8K0TFV9_9PEZI|nr:cryptococcal mannosyltransferase 1-domain-containing protein [Plectosphaerella cucumerina]
MGYLSSNVLYARRVARGRPIRLILIILSLVLLIDTIWVQRNIAVRDLRPRAFDTPRKHERVYIAALHWNSAYLIYMQWKDSVLALADALGHENVFVSIYESGSWDETKDMLGWLDSELASRGVPRHIAMDNVTHEELLENAPGEGEPLTEGWIKTSRSPAELRRIPYLAKLRNKTLRDLWDMADKGITFDKVVFLNDVYFSAEDVLTLLDTNRGVYAAACSLDFSDPPQFYDTFALRDSEGDPHLTMTWPYFRSPRSRKALVEHSPAVPVQSCWNGIVAMPAAPFSSSNQHERLKFRGISDSLAGHHLEGSECCLIHVDNPLTQDLGVFLNPRVRVGYNPKAYEATHPVPGSSWVSVWGILRGRLVNYIRGLSSTSSLDDKVVNGRMALWEAESKSNHEPGRICLIDETQVIAWNGWNHV